MDVPKGTARLRAVTGAEKIQDGTTASNACVRRFHLIDGGRDAQGELNDEMPPSAAGFDPGPTALPARRLDIDTGRRERAALLVLAIGRQAVPEDIVDGPPLEVLQAFEDELWRDEALAHVDILLEVLSPRPRPQDARKAAQR
jgi:hypothetical protein